MKKFFYLILACLMIMTSLTVPELNGDTLVAKASYDTIPEIKTTFYSDDFSGSALNRRIIEKSGSVVQSFGELSVKLSSAGVGWAGAVFSLNENKTPVSSGDFVVQFKLRREDLSYRVCVRGKSSANRDYFGFDWGKGYAAAYYSDTKGINGDAHKLNGFGNENEILVTAYYNIDDQTYSLWLNDTLVVEDKYARFADATDMTQIRIYTEVVGGGFAIDDFIYYSDKVIIIEEPEVPEVKELHYFDDFSDEEFNSRFKTEGEVEWDSESIKISKSSTSYAWAGIDAYLNSDRSAVTSGSFVVQYRLRRADVSHRIVVRTRSGNGRDYLEFDWNKGSVAICYSSVAGVDGKAYSSTKFGSENELLVTTKYNLDNQTYSLWFNDKLMIKDKYPRSADARDLLYMRIYTEAQGVIFWLDDFKYYSDVPFTDEESAELDAELLNIEKLLTEPFVKNNIIGSDLKLPSEGEKKGSSITWISSDPRYISVLGDTGKVTRAMDTDVSNLPEVTLTATFRYGDATFTKDYVFRIQSDYSNVDKLIDSEFGCLTAETLLSQGETDPNAVTCSLNLPDSTLNGIPLSWKSSNKKVIANSGRVIRPRNDSAAEDATMTVSISVDGETREKSFDFTVVPDEKWYDPGHMSDEEFFGKWENGSWIVEGKFDYSHSGLGAVESAAKSGDYEEAKKALLRHIRTRNPSSNYGLGTRSPAYVDFKIADIQTMQNQNYYAGSATVNSDEYKEYYITVKPSQISKGGSTSYGVMAKYNEATEVSIASLLHENPEYRPKIQLMVNGGIVTFEAKNAINIRAGKYAFENYSDSDELKVKTFGEFLGDETYKAMLNFDFSSLSESDQVTSATLIVHAKLDQGFAGSKEIGITFDPYKFKKSDVWNSFKGYIYNFNGLKSGTLWDNIPNSDVEYQYQMARFQQFDAILAEYLFTEDEKYAYYIINSIMSYIYDRGGAETGLNGYPAGVPIFSSWPRTLDTTDRMNHFGRILNYMSNSDYMNSDVCTAILKSIWHMCDGLTKSIVTTGNWAQAEKNAIISTSLSFPEFKKADEWFATSVAFIEELFIKTNNFSDGSYIEKTAGYSQASLANYVSFKNMLLANGKDVSDEYNDMLIKSAYYNLQLYYPNGEYLQWGDDSKGRRGSGAYSLLYRWFGDKELEYIDTFGSKGEKPGWTSMQYTGGKTTFMRSDWTKNALYMFTQVRGEGQHGHQDDNGVLVMAYGKPLLVDSGIFTYTVTDPSRLYGISTRAHNTVEINDISQISGDSGTQDVWVTNNSYDFLSQTSVSYKDFPHKRTVMFVKPDLWIVSDLMTPTDLEKENNYKQLWHMLPTANLTTDEENKTISSNFLTGANIIVASADSDAKVMEAMGKYDYNYQQVTDSKYAYFEKTASGKATFDTVLLPANGTKPEIQVERLDMGVETSEATAIKFETNIEGEKKTYYYMLDYAHSSDSKRTFGNYITDAEVALVCENKRGSVERIILNNGTYIKTTDGKLIAEFENEIADISIEQTGSSVYIESSAESMEGAELYLSNVKTVYVNNQPVIFNESDDGSFVITNEQTVAKAPFDSSNEKGGIGSKGGSSGGVGGSGFSPGVTPPVTPPLDNSGNFVMNNEMKVEIAGYWAEKEITYLFEKGIVKGVSETSIGAESQITRAEFITLLLRLFNIEPAKYNGAFNDVSGNEWHAGYLQAAYDNGIMNGSDGNALPDDFITREQMAKLICTSAESVLQMQNSADISAYEDYKEISPWALEYVEKVVASQIMSGRTQTTFSPSDTAVRAEAFAVIYRLLKLISK